MASVTAAASTAAQSKSRSNLFRNRTFVSLWAGQAISAVGDGFHSVALGFWVLQTTGSAAAMATVMTVRMLAQILLGSFAGAVADRVDRRKLMIGSNVARFGLVLAIALLVKHAGTPLLPVVLLTGLLATVGNFFGPAFQASLVNIVGKDSIQQATSLMQITNTLAQVVGPVLGGTIVGLYGGWAALLGDSISFLVAAALIVAGGAFPSPRREQKARQSFWGDMREGFAYIRSNPLAKGVITLAPPLNFFASAAFLLLPVIAIKVWMASPAQYGTLEAFFPMGFALGAVLVMALAKKMQRRGWWMLLGILMTGVGMMITVLMPSTAAAMPVVLVTGFFNGVLNVLLMTIMQAEVPSEMQGRVFGTFGSITGIANPAAMMVAGLLADRFSPVNLAVYAGIGMVLVSFGCFASKALRNYN